MREQEINAEVRHIQAIYARREAGPRKDRSNPGRHFMIAERDRKMARSLDRHLAATLDSVQVLDVGCGDGSQLAWLHSAGAKGCNLHGIDLLANKIARARHLYPDFDLLAANAERMPFADQSFDLLLVMTVFSSIRDPAMAGNVAAEMKRVLRPRGLILWYDMRYPNPWNPNVRAMSVKRIRPLFPDFALELQTATLIPLIARALGHLSQPNLARCYEGLASLPFLRSHLLGVLRANPASV